MQVARFGQSGHITRSNMVNSMYTQLFCLGDFFSLLYPDSGISMDGEIVLGDMIWSYNKAEL